MNTLPMYAMILPIHWTFDADATKHRNKQMKATVATIDSSSAHQLTLNLTLTCSKSVGIILKSYWIGWRIMCYNRWRCTAIDVAHISRRRKNIIHSRSTKQTLMASFQSNEWIWHQLRNRNIVHHPIKLSHNIRSIDASNELEIFALKRLKN